MITTLSRQGGRRYRQTGLGVGLVSVLINVGGLAPTPPTPTPTPTPPVVEVPAAPVVLTRVPASGGASGGGGGVSWRFESTPYERKARASLSAPLGRLAAHGTVERPAVAAPAVPQSARRMGRLRVTAGMPALTATGYRFNLARHNQQARAVLDEDDEPEARLDD